MRILINGEEIDTTLEQEKTVGDVLRSLQIEFEKNNATMIGISVNGDDVPAEKIDDLDGISIDTVETLDVSALSADTVIDTFKKYIPLIEKVSESLEEFPVILQRGDSVAAAATIKSFADLFDILCHLSTLTAFFPAVFSEKKVEGMTIPEFMASFSPILTDFENAYSSSDTVLSGDLAEYEIKPRLDQFIEAVRSY